MIGDNLRSKKEKLKFVSGGFVVDKKIPFLEHWNFTEMLYAIIHSSKNNHTGSLRLITTK